MADPKLMDKLSMNILKSIYKIILVAILKKILIIHIMIDYLYLF